MRIVGGKWRGKRLDSPIDEKGIRPTKQRTRESLFDILTHNILIHGDLTAFSQRRVIDLFSGTGALGLEALSRGADYALFVEENKMACKLIEANIERLEQAKTTRILRRDATRLDRRRHHTPFNLAFIDPPYGLGHGERALKRLHEGEWLATKAVTILEETAQANIVLPDYFHLIDRRNYGTTQILFLHYGSG